MKRRTFLSLLGAGTAAPIAGCIGEAGSSPTVGTPGPRRISIADVDSATAAGFEIGATILTAEVTESRTARIRIDVTNTGEERAIPVGTGACSLFNRSAKASDPPGLWLSDGEVVTGDDGAENGWVAEDLPTDPEGFGGYGCEPRTYEAGETVRNDYAVYHDGRVGGYMDPGTYRWERTVGVWPSKRAGGGPEETFVWGFSVSVEASE